MSAKKDITSSSAAGQGRKGGQTVTGFERPYPGKPTELLNEREFHDHFCLPNGVSIELVEKDPTPTEKVGHNTNFFSKEQFNARLRFSLSFIFKQFLHYTQIPLTYIYPNIIMVLIECNILNMLFHMNLFLLEVLFIYTIKQDKKDIFSMFAHIPSLQLVIGLPNSKKRGAKRHVLGRGPWVGLMEHPKRDFCLNCTLKISGRDGFERPSLLIFSVELVQLIC